MIAERVVRVGETVVVAARHESPRIERVQADFGLESPSRQHLDQLGQPRRRPWVRRRHESHSITRQ